MYYKPGIEYKPWSNPVVLIKARHFYLRIYGSERDTMLMAEAVRERFYVLLEY